MSFASEHARGSFLMTHIAIPREAAIREACADTKRLAHALQCGDPSSPQYLRAVYRADSCDFSVRRERASVARVASISPFLRSFVLQLARPFDVARHSVVWLTLRFEDGEVADHAFFVVETAKGEAKKPFFGGAPPTKQKHAPPQSQEGNAPAGTNHATSEGGQDGPTPLPGGRPRCAERELLWTRAERLLPARWC